MNFQDYCEERNIHDARLWSTNTKDLTQLRVSKEEAEDGLHIARSKFANSRLRETYSTIIAGSSSMNPTLEREGLFLAKDFLDTDRHAQAKDFITNRHGSLAKSSHTILTSTELPASQRVREPLDASKRKGAIQLRDTALLHIFSHKLAEILGTSVSNPRFAHAMTNNTYLQTVHNMPNDGDIQKDLHQDTFFHCFKWWYYAHAVSLQHGPTRYVKGSHILGKRKSAIMQREYMKYYDGTQENPYSIEGSLRISDEEAENTWGEITSVVVPENTLVVINVFGFHSRSEVFRECKRKAIHGSIRYSNPFS